MEKYEDNFTTTIIMFLLALSVIIAGCLIQLVGIKNILHAQFDYQTGLDMCYEDAQEYNTYCHVERDNNGSYNWYFNTNERSI